MLSRASSRVIDRATSRRLKADQNRLLSVNPGDHISLSNHDSHRKQDSQLCLRDLDTRSFRRRGKRYTLLERTIFMDERMWVQGDNLHRRIVRRSFMCVQSFLSHICTLLISPTSNRIWVVWDCGIEEMDRKAATGHRRGRDGTVEQ